MEDISEEEIHKHEEAEISTLKDKRKVENCPEESLLDSKKLKGSDSKDKKENVSPTIDVQSSDFKDFEFKDDNFDLPMDVKTKYRALCYSLNMLPHDNVSEMMHRDFVRGMIIQIIEIVDQIKASRLAIASLDVLKYWKTILEGFAALGMNVGFLLPRIDSLMKHLIDYQAIKDKGTRLSSEIEVQKELYRKKLEEIKPIEGLIATLVDEFVDILPTKAKLNSEFSKDANKGWDSRIV